jgi:hypothetical protein
MVFSTVRTFALSVAVRDDLLERRKVWNQPREASALQRRLRPGVKIEHQMRGHVQRRDRVIGLLHHWLQHQADLRRLAVLPDDLVRQAGRARVEADTGNVPGFDRLDLGRQRDVSGAGRCRGTRRDRQKLLEGGLAPDPFALAGILRIRRGQIADRDQVGKIRRFGGRWEQPRHIVGGERLLRLYRWRLLRRRLRGRLRRSAHHRSAEQCGNDGNMPASRRPGAQPSTMAHIHLPKFMCMSNRRESVLTKELGPRLLNGVATPRWARHQIDTRRERSALVISLTIID